MRTALVKVQNQDAGLLIEINRSLYEFKYFDDYTGMPVSLTMPVAQKHFSYDEFPPFFEGLLPEGTMLEALLRKYKIDRDDYFSQLIKIGNDVVGAVSIEEAE